MKVEIRMCNREFEDILNTLPVYSDGTRKREDFAKLAAEKSNIPFESLDEIDICCSDGDVYAVYIKGDMRMLNF